VAQLEELTGKLCYEYDPSGLRAAQADLGKTSASMGAAGKSATGMGDATKGAGAKVGRFSGDLKQLNVAGGAAQVSVGKLAVGLGAMGAGAALAMKGAVGASMDLQKALAEVGTIAPTVQADIKGFEADVLKLSQTIGQDAVMATRALYDAVSSGIPAENAISFMEVAGKAAVAGVTDLNTSVTGLTVALNSYNMDASEAGKVSDIMFKTVELGVVTYGELGASMGKVTGIAASMNIPFDAVSAAIAQVSTKGFNGAEAVTAVRSSMVALAKGTPELTAAFKALGVESGEQLLEKFGGYQGAMEALRDYGDDTGMSMVKLMGRVEGANAVLSLTGENADGARTKLEAIGASTGSTADAFALMAETGAQKMAVFHETINALKIGVGDALVPIVGPLVDGLQALAEWFDRLGPGGKTVAAAGLLVAGVIGTLGGALLGATALFGPLIISLSAAGIGLGTVAGAALAATTALLPIAAPILAVAAAIVFLKKGQNEFQAALARTATGLAQTPATLNDYAAAVHKAAAEQDGLSGIITRSNLPSHQTEVIAATDSYLRMQLGVNEVVLSNKAFEAELKKLQSAFRANGDMAAYEQGAADLANKFSVLAGTGMVLTKAEQSVRDSFLETADALARKDKFTQFALDGDTEYARISAVLADTVASGAMSQDQANAALNGYITAAKASIDASGEMAGSMEGNVSTFQKFSDELIALSGGMAMGSGGKELMDDEALAEHDKKIQKIYEDSNKAYADWGAEYFASEQQFAADMEKARQEDADNAYAAAQQAAEQRDKQVTNVAENALKMQKAQEGMAKASEGGDTVKAAKYAEDIANLQISMDAGTGIVTTALSNRAGEVAAAYEAERQAQIEHLAQMALDHLTALLMAGEVSQERADLIYGSLASAFPGSEMFSPYTKAMMDLAGDIGVALTDVTDVGARAAVELGGSITNIDDRLAESGAASGEYKDKVTADWAEQATALGYLVETVQVGEELRYIAVEESTGRIVTSLAVAGESAGTYGEEVENRYEGIRGNFDETAAVAEDTAARQIAQHGNLIDSASTFGEEVEDRYGGVRRGFEDTATTSRTTSGTIQQDMGSIGSSAMGMGDSVASGGATVRQSLDGIRDASSGLGGAVAAGALEASGAWLTASTSIRGSQTVMDAAVVEQIAGSGKVTTATETQITRAGTLKKVEVDAHEVAGAAAQEHGDLAEDGLGRAGLAAEEATELMEDYADAVGDIPKSVTTRVAVQNYEDTFLKLNTLADIVARLGEGANVRIGATLPPGVAPPPGGGGGDPGDPQHGGAGLGDPLWGGKGLGDPLTGDQGYEDWEDGIGAMGDAADDAVTALLDLNDVVADLLSGSLKADWLDLVAQVAAFEAELRASGGAMSDLSDEMQRFFTATTENDSFAYFMSEWARFESHVAPEGLADLEAIRQALMAAIDAGDPEEMMYQWERFYARMKQLEDERFRQEIGNLEEAKKRAEERGDKEHAEGIQAEIDRRRARHESFMDELDLEGEAIDNLYETWEHNEERLEDLTRKREAARKAYLDALKDQQDRLEEAEDSIHDQVMDNLDDQQDALEEQMDIELEAWDRRKAAAESYHDARMSDIEDEEHAVKKALDDQKESIDSMKRDLDALELLPWTDGPFSGSSMTDLETRAKSAEEAVKALEKAMDKLPKFDPSRVGRGRKKKIETGIERSAVTDATLLKALQDAIDAGMITDPRLLSIAQEILAGGKVRADYIREIFDAILAGKEAANAPLQTEIDRREAIILAQKNQIALAEHEYDIAKAAGDTALEELAARKAAEASRYEAEIANIESQRAAAEAYYQSQINGIEKARKAAEKAHDEHMRQIMEAFALELMMADGMSRDEAAAEIERRRREALEIADEAVKRTQESRREGQQWADNEARIREARVRIRAGELGAGGEMPSPFVPRDQPPIAPEPTLPGEGPGRPIIPFPFVGDVTRPGRTPVEAVKAISETAIREWQDLVSRMGAKPPGGKGFTPRTLGGGGGGQSMTLINYGSITLGGKTGDDFEAGLVDFAEAM